MWVRRWVGGKGKWVLIAREGKRNINNAYMAAPNNKSLGVGWLCVSGKDAGKKKKISPWRDIFFFSFQIFMVGLLRILI